MESAEATLTFAIHYVVRTKVLAIEWHNHPDGWFVHFDGSRESLNFGIERPLWDVGDVVKITFAKEDPCPPSPSINPPPSSSS